MADDHADEAWTRQTDYPRTLVESIVTGEAISRVTGRPIDVPHWMELRAFVERTGRLHDDFEAIAAVIDVERALAALQSAHPDAAAVVACVLMLDMRVQDLAAVFGTRRNWGRLLNKAIAWIAGYLSGWSFDECELAYRKAV